MAVGAGQLRAGKVFVEVGAKDNLSKALNRMQAKLKAFGQAANRMGASLARVAAVAAAPFALSLRTFSNFSDTMLQVRGVTQASEDDFKRLTETAKRLGATTSFTAKQVADGMKFLGMAGFDTEQILAGIPDVLNLARAGALDLGIASDIASDVGSAFGLAADDIGRIADVMATTATSANTTIEMMGETFKQAAPLAATAGQSLEDTATAIGALANSGVKASMAGTDLARVMKQMADPSVQKSMAGIGVSALDSAGDMRSVLDVMKDLGAATDKMAGGERLAFFSQNFGRAAKSAAILSKAGDSIDELSDKIANSAGSAQRIADTMDSGIGGAFRRLMSAIEGVQIAIGETLAPIIAKIADAFATVAGVVKEFVLQNQQLVIGVVAAIAGIGALGAGLLSLKAVTWLVTTAIGAFSIGIKMATGAVVALKAVIAGLLSPIGLVIAGVAGIGAAILVSTGVGGAALDWLKKQFAALHDAVSYVLGGIIDALKSGEFGLAARILWLSLKVAWETGIAPLRNVWAGFMSTFGELFHDGIAYVRRVWAEFGNWLWKSFPETMGAITELWVNSIAVLKNAWAKFQTWLAKRWLELQSLWDKTLDLSAAKAAAEDQLQVELENIESERGAGVAETFRKEGLSPLGHDDERDEQLLKIDRERQAAIARMNDAQAASISDAESALDDAKRELASAINESKAIKKQREESLSAPDAPGKLPKQQSPQDFAAGIKSAVDKITATKTSAGTFNAGIAGQITNLGVFNRINEHSRVTSENTKEIVRLINQGGKFV